MITVALREKMGLPPRASAAPEPSSNLDKGTLLDRVFQLEPAARRLVLRYYRTSKVLEATWGIYKQENNRANERGNLTPEEILHNQARAARRAQLCIKRDCLAISADRMVTLTYVSNMQDRKVALDHLAKFFRLMKKRFRRWQTVAVLEYQQRGAIHFHLALSGFYDISPIRNAWQDVTAERAIVNVSFKPYGGGNSYGKLASYMSKYLAKDGGFTRHTGEHRYFRSGSIERPKEVYYVPDSAPKTEEVTRAIECITALLGSPGHFPQVWSGSSRYGVGGFVVGSGFTH